LTFQVAIFMFVLFLSIKKPAINGLFTYHT